MNAGLTAVSCIAWLGGGVASPHAWQVDSADEKRGFTSDDRIKTLPETQAITPRVARKESQRRIAPRAAHRSRIVARAEKCPLEVNCNGRTAAEAEYRTSHREAS